MNRPTIIKLSLSALLAAGIGTAIYWDILRAAPKPGPAISPAVSQSNNGDNFEAIILAPHSGEEAIDQQIVAAQKRLRAVTPAGALEATEHLGHLFITKARLSHDSGFYKLAEQCAVSMDSREPGNPEGLLLRGHVLDALHHFKEAEKIGRHLVSVRENVLDHALLGDALLEQGRVDESVPVYQNMIDLKPCLITYSRISYLRWIKGDLEGALELMQQAVETGSARDPEPLAWTTTRLATLEVQMGQMEAVHRTIARALEIIPGYAPALLLKGKVLLGQAQEAQAVEVLKEAVRSNPIPEYQWALADALRAAQQPEEAAKVEETLRKSGRGEDPRTFSLFLSTRGTEGKQALELAEAELECRKDIFTYDAVGWAQRAAGQLEAAWMSMKKALGEETEDARLFLHAGVIASELARTSEADDYLGRANKMHAMLLPSERALLEARLAASKAGR